MIDENKESKILKFPEEITFPEENVEENLDYLKNLNGNNKILNKVYSKKTTFSGEVNDLFYFYNTENFYYRNMLKKSKLRENHDKRLGELEGALNNVNLSAIEDKEKLKDLEGELGRQVKRSKNPAPAPWARTDPLMRMFALSTLEQMYEGMEGNMNVSKGLNIKSLYSNPLKKEIRNNKLRGISLNILPIVSAAGFYFAGGVVAGAVMFGLGEAYITLLANPAMSQATSKPMEYEFLKEKSKRMDKFIQTYVKEKK